MINERKEQLKAGAIAIVALLAVALIVPASGGFADWYNQQNSVKTTVDAMFTSIATTYDMSGANALRLSSATGPASFYYWYNTSSINPLNKNNITAFAAGVFTVATLSTAKNNVSGQDTPNNNGWPYWIIYYNFRAWDAYYDNVVRIKLNLTSLHTGQFGNYGDWGKTVTLAWSDGTTDLQVWTGTTAASDSKLTQYIDLDTNALRAAITQFGRLSGYLKLTITHEDRKPIATSAMYTFSSASLLGRDDALGAGCVIAGVFGFVGALLVQPNISLNDLMGRGRQGKGRGR